MAYVRLCALAFVACAVPAAACGGATDTGLFDGTGSDASTSAPATSSSVDASANSAPVKDAAAPPDTTSDASKSVTPDAAHPVTPDAAPPAATIACGQGAGCDPGTSVCCLPATNSGNGNGGGNGNGNGSTSAPTCESSSDCTKSGGAPVACGNAADCAAAGAPSGSVCCVTEDPQSGIAVNTTCVDPTACTADTQAQVCDPNAAGSCPSGTTCTASMKTIPGYSICR